MIKTKTIFRIRIWGRDTKHRADGKGWNYECYFDVVPTIEELISGLVLAREEAVAKYKESAKDEDDYYTDEARNRVEEFDKIIDMVKVATAPQEAPDVDHETRVKVNYAGVHLGTLAFAGLESYTRAA
jgi:hypothetical protein